jgi:type IX secretion system PorP/SprF family membrane protein
VSFALPVRNSLTFNRFALNPTFSFVREQNQIISFTNKREWVQFDDAPSAFLFSYSGRLNENSGFGVAAFQQNYGVLTNFGAVLNYAYNVELSYESNLTFGANLGVYQSGVNTGNVVTNIPDPSLDNVPSNFLMTINPSINYGTRFLDFGLTLNNFALYNFTTSGLVEGDPERGIQAHAMYTGFMQPSGFFNDSKFSALLRSEFKESDVVLSGLMMLTVPKGIWGQLGYSTLNGFSVGLGLNVVKGVSLEYNYEKRLGNLVDFGSAHEITLAYTFKPNKRQRYDDAMDMASLIPEKRKVRVSKTDEATRARIAARAEARRLARAEAAKANTQKPLPKVETRLASTENSETEAARQAELTAARARAEELAKQQAEAEALAKIKAKQEAEEAERLARLKAEEAQRQQAAQEALALAEAEEKRQQELAEAEAAQKRAEALARIKEAEEAAEAERMAQLRAEEAQREKEAAEALALAEAEAQKQRELTAKEEARVRAEEQVRLKKEQEAQQEAQRLAQLKAEEAQRREAAIAAAAALEAEKKLAIEKEKQEARIKAEEEAKLRAQKAAEAEAIRLAELKANEEKRRQEALAATALAEKEEAERQEAIAKQDRQSTAIQNLTETTNVLRQQQEDLIEDLSSAIDAKKQDLADLKEENDLSERGIYKAPKPFKSVSEENAKLAALTNNLDKTINEQEQKIKELKQLLNKRREQFPSDDDEMNMIYLDEIVILQKSQKKTREVKEALLLELQKINTALEVERKRRIKRASYDNQEDRYAKDMADLKRLKENVAVTNEDLSDLDLDYGDSKGGTIKILKDVKYTEDGFYLVLAIHSNKEKRDEFLKAVMASGNKDVSFFYDVNTSKYYIYSTRFNSLSEANKAMTNADSKAFNENMSMIKIENKSMK